MHPEEFYGTIVSFSSQKGEEFNLLNAKIYDVILEAFQSPQTLKSILDILCWNSGTSLNKASKDLLADKIFEVINNEYNTETANIFHNVISSMQTFEEFEVRFHSDFDKITNCWNALGTMQDCFENEVVPFELKNMILGVHDNFHAEFTQV